MSAPDSSLVDEHPDALTDQGIAPGGGDRILQFAQLGEPFVHQRSWNGAVEPDRVCALFRAVGEEAAPVELRRLDEVEQLIVVVFRLAWISDDEVAAERGFRFAVADVADATKEATAIAPSPHATQERLADMLQREVE